MNVYVIVCESYASMDDSFDTTVEVFETLDSAKAYFEMMKLNIIQDYIEYTEYQTLEEMIDDDFFYMDETPTSNGDEYFYIDYEDFGHDKLRIVKKPVMKFNMED